MPETDCDLCASGVRARTTTLDFESYDCPRCGALRLNRNAIAILPNLRKRANEAKIDAVSHWARRRAGTKGTFLTVTGDDATRWFQEAALATPMEQVRNLMIWLGSHREAGCDPAMDVETTTEELASIVGGRSKKRIHGVPDPPSCLTRLG